MTDEAGAEPGAEAALTFEDALDGLEGVVDDLERGELDLSASLARYREGVALLARCQALLDGVDRSVALLTGVEPDGTPITAPFDASATAAVAPAPAPSSAPAVSAPKARAPRAKPDPGPVDELDFDPPF